MRHLCLFVVVAAVRGWTAVPAAPQRGTTLRPVHMSAGPPPFDDEPPPPVDPGRLPDFFSKENFDSVEEVPFALKLFGGLGSLLFLSLLVTLVVS